MTLALKETGFGPCNQDPSNGIFPLQGQEFLREEKVFTQCEGIVGIPGSAQEAEWQVEKLAHLIVIQFLLGSVVLMPRRINKICF